VAEPNTPIRHRGLASSSLQGRGSFSCTQASAKCLVSTVYSRSKHLDPAIYATQAPAPAPAPGTTNADCKNHSRGPTAACDRHARISGRHMNDQVHRGYECYQMVPYNAELSRSWRSLIRRSAVAIGALWRKHIDLHYPLLIVHFRIDKCLKSRPHSNYLIPSRGETRNSQLHVETARRVVFAMIQLLIITFVPWYCLSQSLHVTGLVAFNAKGKWSSTNCIPLRAPIATVEVDPATVWVTPNLVMRWWSGPLWHLVHSAPLRSVVRPAKLKYPRGRSAAPPVELR
jgi:hypothetical protein